MYIVFYSRNLVGEGVVDGFEKGVFSMQINNLENSCKLIYMVSQNSTN